MNEQTRKQRFYHLGERTQIEPGSQFHGEEEISLGANVFVRTGAWFNIASEITGERPKIVVGDNCQFNTGVSVSAVRLVVVERFALVGPNVYISDANHEYRNIGIPIVLQGTTGGERPTIIGEGAWLGANAVVCGGATVGKGAVIGANSVVTRDIPDYCVAAGAPARIVKLYDPAVNEWVKVGSEAQAQDVMRRRRERPLLSVCIPTYNRAADLKRCLLGIYGQLGDCSLVEVVVSDNASEDDTQQVLGKYASRHEGLRYWRNEENIGAERNILKLLDEARGCFILLHGDDDFFVDYSLLPLLQVLQTHRDCSVIHLDLLDDSHRTERGEGIEQFLRAASLNAGFISSIIVKREAVERIADRSKFLDSCFNHIYLQLEAIRLEPNFCVIHKSMFTYAGNNPAGYNFGEAFIKGYLSIVEHYRSTSELSEAAAAEEKKRALLGTVLPWYERIVREKLGTDVSGFENIFTEHYASEPYYEEVLRWLRELERPQ